MRSKDESITRSPILILAGLLVLAGCGQAQDSSTTAADSVMSDQTSMDATTELAGAPHPGDACTAIDPNAAILSSGFGLDPSNTRNAVSRINASNIDRLRLRFALGGPAQEKRGAPAVTEQALFYFVGNQIVAASRSTGCTFWTATLTSPATGDTEVPRSSSILLVDNPSGGRMLFVGALSGFVYGLDAADGSTVWSARVSQDPLHIITGGMQFSAGRLFVPVATGEVILAAKPGSSCCSSHGLVVAFNAFNGDVIWTFDSVPPGSSGGSVWSALSIDSDRNQLLLGVGQNFTQPATAFSDAIVALDLDTGAVNWSFQATEGDAWHAGCEIEPPINCPDPEGPDFDFGAGAILTDLPGSGGQVVIAGDKAGSVFSLDPATGALNWSTKIGVGGKLGGIHWGMAVDDTGVYAGISDLSTRKTVRLDAGGAEQARTSFMPGATPGVYKLDLLTGDVLWEFHANHLFETQLVPSAFSAAVSVTNDVVFAPALDGELFALRASDGKRLWSFQTRFQLAAPDGSTVQGGTLDSVGAFAVDDMVLLNSGYNTFGGRNLVNAGTGNGLFVFELADSDGVDN